MKVAGTATPAPGTRIARMVDETDMPGGGSYEIFVNKPVAQTWNSLKDAETAVRALTEGDETPGAAIFKKDGKFGAATLTYGHPGWGTDEYHPWPESVVCRTVDGRSLVKVVNGEKYGDPSFSNFQDFRRYLKYADGEE